jgi:predicted metal-dependent hydrolase
MSLRYYDDRGFEVVLPARVPMREVEPFVRGMEPWILRIISTRRRPMSSPVPFGLFDGAQVPYLGTTLTLRLEWAPGDRSTIQLDDATRTLHARLVHDAPMPLEDLVEVWYRYAAKTILPERVQRYTTTLGVRYGRIAIKDARTRWGSCSTKGNLNFSWRLLLAPDEVLDYVVAHEVAHLVELNHSPRYWATLARLYPDFKAPQAWLKRHGPALMRWPGNLTPTLLLRGEGRLE